MLRSAGLKQRTPDSSALSENLHFCVRGLPLRGEPMKGIVGNRLTELDNEADRATTSSFIPDVPIHSPSSSTTIIFFSLLFLFLLSLSLSLPPLSSLPPPSLPVSLFITFFFSLFLGFLFPKEPDKPICKGREDEVQGRDLILLSLTQLHILAAFLIHPLHISPLSEEKMRYGRVLERGKACRLATGMQYARDSQCHCSCLTALA